MKVILVSKSLGYIIYINMYVLSYNGNNIYKYISVIRII